MKFGASVLVSYFLLGAIFALIRLFGNDTESSLRIVAAIPYYSFAVLSAVCGAAIFAIALSGPRGEMWEELLIFGPLFIAIFFLWKGFFQEVIDDSLLYLALTLWITVPFLLVSLFAMSFMGRGMIVRKNKAST